MNIYPVNKLRANVILDHSLYSRVDGIKFLQAGSQITEQSLTVLRRRHEEEVYGLNVEEEIAVDLAERELPELEPRPLNVKALKSGEQIARGLFEVDGVRILLTEGRTLRSEDINALGTLSSVQPESVLVWYRSRFIESDDPVTMRLSAYYGSLHDIAARREEHVEVDLSRVSSNDSLGPYFRKAPPRLRSNRELREFSRHIEDAVTRVGGWTETRYADGAPRLSGAILRDQRNIVGETTDRIFEDADLAANLLNLNPSADFLKDHAFKSSLLSLEVASASGFTKQEALHLGLAALLQDMGMASLDEAVVNKQSPLTPREIASIRSHPSQTVEELLRSGTGLPNRVVDTVLMSHERPNGTGYPQGLSGSNVTPSARILAAVNVYVALTADRPYRPAWGTYDTVFFLIQAANQGDLDKSVIRTLLSILSLFPVGTLVTLDTGETARVVSTNEHAYTRPVVSIIFDASGKPRKPRLVDLVADTEHEIVGIVDPAAHDIDPMLGF